MARLNHHKMLRMMFLSITKTIPCAKPDTKCVPGEMIPKKNIDSCPHAETCSPGSYGHTVYIKKHGDFRFHPRIPIDFDQNKDIYRQRTACEQVNDRVLNDYHMQHLKIWGRNHFSFSTIIIGICIHLDADLKPAVCAIHKSIPILSTSSLSKN